VRKKVEDLGLSVAGVGEVIERCSGHIRVILTLGATGNEREKKVD
jgi:hypothetical protein